ncbi:hypothetical protein CHS0354_005909 [Potamilus streckersoni]|uniref:Uncharacterized protein n=1 Tax=Potamilus streckersoni TaxID=2493646 RepID=A0AAE0W6W7_9BIVA|nr:hypothetical protein CHS0354_005909 [Potamilus streckersoni]
MRVRMSGDTRIRPRQLMVQSEMQDGGPKEIRETNASRETQKISDADMSYNHTGMRPGGSEWLVS